MIFIEPEYFPRIVVGVRSAVQPQEMDVGRARAHVRAEATLRRRGESEGGERRALGGVPREQKMLEGHLTRVMYHSAYYFTKKKIASIVFTSIRRKILP